MKWFAISGSWRVVNKEVEEDVRNTVSKIICNGDGITTGGALGVDSIATQVVLEKGNPRKQLKIFLPIKLEAMCKHFFKRAGEGVITQEQAESITSQLKKVKKLAPGAIIDDTPWTEANIESYYGRNSFIIETCDELLAFQVNDSKGTQDAIDKARNLGKPVHVKKYYVELHNF